MNEELIVQVLNRKMPPRRKQQRQQSPKENAYDREANENLVPQLVNLLMGALTNQLNFWLYNQISMFQPNSFTTGLERTINVDGEGNTLAYNQEQRGKKSEDDKLGDSHTGNARKRKWDNNINAENQQGKEKKKVEACSNCGKKHVGVCLRGKRVCFNCGSKDHIAPKCSRPRKRACFTCGSKEHLARGCPKKAAGKASGSKGDSGKLVIVESATPSRPNEQATSMKIQNAMQGMVPINYLYGCMSFNLTAT